MKKTFIPLIVAVVVLVLSLGAYALWYSMVTAKSAEASSLAAQIATQSNASAKVAQAKEEISQLSSQEATINQYFIATNDVVPFLEQIQSIGKFLGADVKVVSVSAVPGTPYGHLDLSLTITGSFDAVSRTVGAIEYEPYDTSITNFSLSATPDPGAATSTLPDWTGNAEFSIGAQTGTTTTP
jgi:Tfp pilus assembly protein PilO